MNKSYVPPARSSLADANFEANMNMSGPIFSPEQLNRSAGFGMPFERSPDFGEERKSDMQPKTDSQDQASDDLQPHSRINIQGRLVDIHANGLPAL